MSGGETATIVAGDFTAVTTESKRKRHWSLTRYMERGLERNPRPGLSGYALCGGYRAVDQERLTWQLGLWGLKPVTISDLPPCKQCDKGRNRRMEGRAYMSTEPTTTKYTLEPLETGDEEGCGYSWAHTCRNLGDRHWECTECGAEGWDEPADGAS